MSLKIAAFQQKQGIWITSNCQHIQEGVVSFYGIHKDAQVSLDKETARALYKDLKLHVLQLMGLPASTEVVQVVGDSASFSLVGTNKGKSILREKLSWDVVVLYGFTGHKEEDGTRCVNASVTDVIEELGIQ